MEVLFFWVLFSFGVGALANSRGRSGIGFWLLSVLLSPLIGLFAVLVMSDLKAEAKREHRRKLDHERDIESIRAIAKSNSLAAPVTVATGQATVSVADELLKLAELRDKGVLTEQEFQSQKSAILKASGS